MAQCIVDGCKNEVTKPDHELCYDHWKLSRAGKLYACQQCRKPMEKDQPLCLDCYSRAKGGQGASLGLTSTKIGEKVGLKADRVNGVFAELAWITRGPGEHGWTSTLHGKKRGAVDREFGTERTPFVLWPESILCDKAFVDAVHDYKGEKPTTQDAPATSKGDELSYRERFPATHRATDGHMVRSRGEMLIDNWLYGEQIIHAYERKVPIDEELYCDFYLPTGKVYVEFWGMENDPAYAARKKTKIDLYRMNGLNLIELRDADIKNLDDVLPSKLRQYGIKVS